MAKMRKGKKMTKEYNITLDDIFTFLDTTKDPLEELKGRKLSKKRYIRSLEWEVEYAYERAKKFKLLIKLFSENGMKPLNLEFITNFYYESRKKFYENNIKGVPNDKMGDIYINMDLAGALLNTLAEKEVKGA